LTDSYTGIAPSSVLAFIAAQAIGALAAFFAVTLFSKSRDNG
jgi:glycerol uptake facilitator-like aquaporin